MSVVFYSFFINSFILFFRRGAGSGQGQRRGVGGSGRGRGRGGRSRAGPAPTREQLDAQLDEYNKVRMMLYSNLFQILKIQNSK